jgi:hypothetical protein
LIVVVLVIIILFSTGILKFWVSEREREREREKILLQLVAMKGGKKRGNSRFDKKWRSR